MAERSVHVARVSGTGQDEDNQLPDLQGWSDGHGYEVKAEIKIHGKSAFHGHHKEELYQAVRLVELGKADVVVMWALDRSSRQGLRAAVDFRSAIQDAGGRLEFTEEPELNGTDNDADEAFANAAIDARRESEKRIRRIKAGNAKAVANGAAMRRPKYGWTLDGRKRRKAWVPDDGAKAEVIRGLFERAAEGMPLRQLQDWARGQDGSIRWSWGHVRRIIADTAYYGRAETTVDGQPYVYECPPIVELGLWQKANATLKDPKRYARPPESPFTGIITCGACGRGVRRTSSAGQGSSERRYWRCTGGCPGHKYAPLSARIDAAIRSIQAELFDEVPVEDTDTREVRRTLLNSELRDIGRKGLSPDAMVKRIGEITAGLAAIDAETKPRKRVERNGLGVGVGEAYAALDHDDPACVNTWLRRHNVRIWAGGNTAEIIMRESSAFDADGQSAYGEQGLVITWWLKP
jgi:DNA invertase Pin-like site-specific DNA recombinase